MFASWLGSCRESLGAWHKGGWRRPGRRRFRYVDSRDAKITDDALAAVMRGVGEELGNTPAVARASYVSPVVVDHYLAGRTLSDYRSSSGAAPKHLAVAEHALMEMLEDTAG